MSAFTAIDLAKLPAPTIIERKDFETILAELKAWLIEQEPDLELALGLESEPMTKVLEAWAYREMLLRADIDDAARSNMLAFAAGASLDHLAALFGVERAVVQAADATAVPPIEEVLESDERLRVRAQLALEGYTSAGPVGSYVFWGMTASALVKDIAIDSPEPGDVRVTVLSTEGDGTPDAALLQVVEDQLTAEEVRPLNDVVTVQAATVTPYLISAVLTLYEGPDAEVVRAASEAAALAYAAAHHQLGHDITLSGLYAALHQEGVQKVILASPASDIVIPATGAAYCDSIAVTIGGTDV